MRSEKLFQFFFINHQCFKNLYQTDFSSMIFYHNTVTKKYINLRSYEHKLGVFFPNSSFLIPHS